MTQPHLLRRHAMALALLALCSLPVAAQDYPSKPVKLVIPFPAGGSSDGIGRQIADKLGGILKQSVVVENKGGAGGMIGADAVAKSAPDGYTLVLVDVFHTSTPVYTRKMPYDAVKDFTPISLIGRSPAFLVASPTFEPRTGRDTIAYAKAQPEAKAADQQAFFGAWSKLWGQQVSENVAAERLAAEIHAPGPLRSNVPLSNLPAFGAAYGCKAGQPMQRAEADQVRVWR